MIRVPAEWERQESVWIAWPHNHDTWPGRFAPIPKFFRRWVALIAPSIRVNVIGDPKFKEPSELDSMDRVTWHNVSTNDCWVRDYGPTFVIDSASGTRYVIDWKFNAWGGKYSPWDLDNNAASRIGSLANWPVRSSPLCLEGGALEWDGAGRLLTTSSCLVTKTRNPNWGRQQIVAHLAEIAGLKEVVWVDGGGLAGDDTDGHIDQLARFVDPHNVVVATCNDRGDPNYSGLEANFELLRRWGAKTSPSVSIHPLPIPPKRMIDGQRIPESYCNFVRLGPERMLVPTFNHRESDEQAIDVLSELSRRSSPEIVVEPIDCSDLVWGLGALHCASLNEPLV